MAVSSGLLAAGPVAKSACAMLTLTLSVSLSPCASAMAASSAFSSRASMSPEVAASTDDGTADVDAVGDCSVSVDMAAQLAMQQTSGAEALRLCASADAT